MPLWCRNCCLELIYRHRKGGPLLLYPEKKNPDTRTCTRVFTVIVARVGGWKPYNNWLVHLVMCGILLVCVISGAVARAVYVGVLDGTAVYGVADFLCITAGLICGVAGVAPTIRGDTRNLLLLIRILAFPSRVAGMWCSFIGITLPV